MPAPCKFFTRVDLYRNDHIDKIKNEASRQCNRPELPASCFELFEKDNKNDSGDGSRSDGGENNNVDNSSASAGGSSSSSSSSSSIPDSVTVEEYELFHKSLVLRIKKGDCADYLLTI